MSRGQVAVFAAAIVWSTVLLVNPRAGRGQSPQNGDQGHSPLSANPSMFAVASECLACHNNLIAPTGEDVSIGASWRGSIMANSARDPYVLASVRREILDHPSLGAEIEDECATCHMPAAQKAAQAAGGHGRVFWQDGQERGGTLVTLARDVVTCTV
jgi:hypothetical protein